MRSGFEETMKEKKPPAVFVAEFWHARSTLQQMMSAQRRHVPFFETTPVEGITEFLNVN